MHPPACYNKSMAVTVIVRKEEHQLTAPLTVKEALDQLGLPVELYLVLRSGVMLDEKALLADGDTIRLVGVMSGG